MARLDWYIRAGLKPRHFQLLVALDDYRQIGKVAALMNVTTPAVSKTLTELEEGLGMKLFERSVRGVTPTAFGECMIRGAKMMLRGLAAVGAELHALSHGVTGKIRIGVLPSSAISLLPASLLKLKKLSPATPAIVREATMDVLLHEMRSGSIELILGTLPVRKADTDVDEEVLFEDQTTVVVRSGHPLALRESLDWIDLSPYPWILPPEGSLLREPLSQWFRDSGLPEPPNVIETLSLSFIRSYLAHSDAIATMPASTSKELAKSRFVEVLPLPLPSLVRPVGLLWSMGRPLSPSARLFRECLRKVIEQQREGTGKPEEH